MSRGRKICFWIGISLLFALVVTGVGIGIAVLIGINRFPGLPPVCTSGCVHFDHSKFTTFLQRYTIGGPGLSTPYNSTLVHYRQLMDDDSLLQSYVDELAAAPLAKLNEVRRER
jgi:hypothetical protein